MPPNVHTCGVRALRVVSHGLVYVIYYNHCLSTVHRNKQIRLKLNVNSAVGVSIILSTTVITVIVVVYYWQ